MTYAISKSSLIDMNNTQHNKGSHNMNSSRIARMIIVTIIIIVTVNMGIAALNTVKTSVSTTHAIIDSINK